MSDHPAEAWVDRRASPAGLLALLILAGVSAWLGWYAYRGQLGRLLSATPEFEVDLRPAVAQPANSLIQPSDTTPSVVVNLTPNPPASPPAHLPATTTAPAEASAGGGSSAIPEAQPLSPASPSPAPSATAAAAPPATPPHGVTGASAPPAAAPVIVASALPPAAPVAGPNPAPSPPASSVTTPATSVPPAEATDPELLAAIGPPPAPVTHPAPPALPPAPAKPAASAAGQQASAIDAFLPQSGAGTPAWQRYARPFDNNDPRPRIAIVITKLGLLHGTTLAAIDQLPADVTLSFSPYAMNLEQWIAHARGLGHEVMLDLPMEPSQGGADPGPEALLTSLSADQNLQRLDWVLGRADGYVGLAGVLGDRFTASPVGLRPVLRDIQRHGLMFLDPHQTTASVASVEATKQRLPRAIADLTIDDTPDRVSIDAQLAELERRARITGFAVGLANGYPVTIERLAEWSRGLPERNLALAPVSAIADQQADR